MELCVGTGGVFPRADGARTTAGGSCHPADARGQWWPVRPVWIARGYVSAPRARNPEGLWDLVEPNRTWASGKLGQRKVEPVIMIMIWWWLKYKDDDDESSTSSMKEGVSPSFTSPLIIDLIKNNSDGIEMRPLHLIKNNSDGIEMRPLPHFSSINSTATIMRFEVWNE